jgi:hypothetical protein
MPRLGFALKKEDAFEARGKLWKLRLAYPLKNLFSTPLGVIGANEPDDAAPIAWANDRSGRKEGTAIVKWHWARLHKQAMTPSGGDA